MKRAVTALTNPAAKNPAAGKSWERDDRSKNEPAKEVPPGTIPDQEPYGGTEDINLTNEEGVTYEPPENPPPHRKD